MIKSLFHEDYLLQYRNSNEGKQSGRGKKKTKNCEEFVWGIAKIC